MGEGGRNFPGAESLLGSRKVLTMSQVLSSTADLFSKDPRFEHGGAKLASCPGRYLTSQRPWPYCVISQVNTVHLYLQHSKTLELTEKYGKHVLQLTAYCNQIYKPLNCYVNRLITVIFHVFFNRSHLVPLFYSGNEPKFIKHMITVYDCYAYETMFWRCSTENYMKSCFKTTLLIITHTVIEVYDSSRRKLIQC